VSANNEATAFRTQMYSEQHSHQLAALSNALKKAQDTQQGLVGNMKP
jgi:hypothetical protein